LDTVSRMEQPPTWDESIARAMLAVASNAIPMAGAVIEPLMITYEDVRARRAHRAQLVLGAVAAGIGSAECLGQRLRESPEHETQFVQAVEEAIRTGHDAKRRLLIRAVVNSLQHEELFDESQLIIDALAQLEVMHIRALARLDEELGADGTWAVPLRLDEGGQVTAEDERRGNGFSPAWTALPTPLQAALVRAGVCNLYPPSTLAPSRAPSPLEGINSFGRDLLGALRLEASESGP
jgi:hypothetical protein